MNMNRIGFVGMIGLALLSLGAAETRPASQPTTAAAYPLEWVAGFQAADTAKTDRLARLAEQIKRQTDPKKLADLRKQQTILRYGKVPTLPPLSELEIGNAGPLELGTAKVDQIVDARQMRARLYCRDPYFRIVDEPLRLSEAGFGMLAPGAEPEPAPVLSARCVWLRGVDTRQLADGGVFTTDQFFIVTCTQTYQTALGARQTEFVLEPLDKAKWEAAYLIWKNNSATRRPERSGP